jgi:hypothetical protein
MFNVIRIEMIVSGFIVGFLALSDAVFQKVGWSARTYASGDERMIYVILAWFALTAYRSVAALAKQERRSEFSK